MKNVKEEGTRLASEIAKRPSPTSHLPNELVRAAMLYAQRRRSSGASNVELARELGVSVMTIRRWVMDGVATAGRRERRKSKARMRAVRVVDTAPSLPTTIVATTRDGLRIEGLTVSDLVTLLRGLG